MPRFDLFPPGSKVLIACVRGLEPGVVHNVDKPSDLQIMRQPIIGDGSDRVPVRWTRHGEITWIVPGALTLDDEVRPTTSVL